MGRFPRCFSVFSICIQKPQFIHMGRKAPIQPVYGRQRTRECWLSDKRLGRKLFKGRNEEIEAVKEMWRLDPFPRDLSSCQVRWKYRLPWTEDLEILPVSWAGADVYSLVIEALRGQTPVCGSTSRGWTDSFSVGYLRRQLTMASWLIPGPSCRCDTARAWSKWALSFNANGHWQLLPPYYSHYFRVHLDAHRRHRAGKKKDSTVFGASKGIPNPDYGVEVTMWEMRLPVK